MSAAEGTAAGTANQHDQIEQHIDGFIASRPWAQGVVGLHARVHAMLEEELEPLQIQPTVWAPDGKLYQAALDGSSCLSVTTHRGQNIIRHKFKSLTIMPRFGVLATKTGVQACWEQGTPFMEIAMNGNSESVMLVLLLSPRLNTLLHYQYLNRYYTALPPGAESSGGHLLTFDQLHARMTERTPDGGSSWGKAYQQGPAAGGTGTSSKSNKEPAPATHGGQHVVYKHYVASRVYSRICGSHGCMFSFNPSDADAMQAVQEDVEAFVRLYSAWVRHDGQGPPLQEPLLSECRSLSVSRSHHLGEAQADEVKMLEMQYGAEALNTLRDTLTGQASLAGKPWWDTPVC